jgi:hypothetical protein
MMILMVHLLGCIPVIKWHITILQESSVSKIGTLLYLEIREVSPTILAEVSIPTLLLSQGPVSFFSVILFGGVHS